MKFVVTGGAAVTGSALAPNLISNSDADVVNVEKVPCSGERLGTLA